MFQTLKNAWKIPELRNRLLFTLLIIVIYRLGSQIPMPWVDGTALQHTFDSMGGSALGWLNIMSGGALAQATLFALSVSPYITASIVIQLLTVAIPAFEKWAKEGESGKKKLSLITRILTAVLALVTSVGYTLLIMSQSMTTLVQKVGSGSTVHYEWINGKTTEGFGIAEVFQNAAFQFMVIIACYCAAASLIMWLAERINEHGIGNGISIILFANIITQLPTMAYALYQLCFIKGGVSAYNAEGKLVLRGLGSVIETYGWQIFWGVLLCLLFVAILVAFIVAIVWFSNSERRIPVQYAKRVVGRKMYGGQSSSLPIKLDMTGVMPVIFSSSIVSILPTIAGFIPNTGFGKFVTDYLGTTTFPYIALFLILIVAFAYFYSMISFNPVEVANNLRNNGGAVPGIRPGKPTVDYINKILHRITLLGAIFLCVLAGLPMIVNAIWHLVDGVGIPELTFSGTSLLIMVGVALETFRELEAQMTLRNYKGFLD